MFGESIKNKLILNFYVSFQSDQNYFELGAIANFIAGHLRRSEEDGFYHCYYCEYKTKKHSDMARHIEAKHESSGGYNCEYCGIHTPTRNSLRVHIGRKHKDLLVNQNAI